MGERSSSGCVRVHSISTPRTFWLQGRRSRLGRAAAAPSPSFPAIRSFHGRFPMESAVQLVTWETIGADGTSTRTTCWRRGGGSRLAGERSSGFHARGGSGGPYRGERCRRRDHRLGALGILRPAHPDRRYVRPCVAPQWKGRSPSSQESPRAVSDGSGGAVITSGVYAMRVLVIGQSRSRLAPTRRGARDRTGQTPTGIAADGTGGAVIAWGNGTSIHAARVTGSGTVPWTPNGVPIAVGGPKAFPRHRLRWPRGVTSSPGRTTAPRTVPVSTSSPITCSDQEPSIRNGLRTAGRSPRARATHPAQGHEPILIASGSGGAILGWNESLIPYCTKPDIFAMHLFAPQVACAEVSFDLDPDTFNLKSMGRWVTGAIYSPPSAVGR